MLLKWVMGKFINMIKKHNIFRIRLVNFTSSKFKMNV